MTLPRSVSLALPGLGVAAVLSAIVWWALSYWQVWRYDYLPLSQAGRCLVADSTICRLASALCTGQHRAPIAQYSPWLLWLGAALACGTAPLAWMWPARSRHSPQ